MKDNAVATKTFVLVMVAVAIVTLGSYLLIKKGGAPQEEIPPGEEGPEAVIFELPSWENAASWTFSFFSELENVQFTVAADFIGESTIGEEVCYRLDYSYSPPLQDIITNARIWVRKDTLLPMKFQYLQEDNLLWESAIIYTLSDNMWPLEVGKEFTLTENLGAGTMLQSYLVKVETVENVTVPAGTFECAKIVYYHDSTVTKVEWYSPQVKWYVKTEDKLFGLSLELQSY